MPADALVDWLRDVEPGPLDGATRPERPRRARWLLAVAGGLWLGLAAVAWHALGAGPEQSPPAEDLPVPHAAAPSALAAVPPAVARDGGGRGAVVAAHAVVAVREAVAGAPLGSRRRYLDLAVAEQVSWEGDVAVVTVLGVVLVGDEHAWHSARTARFAVAVTARGAPSTLAGPWPLPVEPAAGPAPEWTPVADAELLARAAAALEAAGYRELTDLQLARTAVGPTDALRATVRGVPPGGEAPETLQVLLAADAGAVLGQVP